MATRLRLTRNQLAVIAHNDAESIRQLELLLLTVNLLDASTSSIVSADASLSSADVTMSATLSSGVYLVDCLIIRNGTTTLSIIGDATVTSSTLSATNGVNGDGISGAATRRTLFPTATGPVFSSALNETMSIQGAITVTVAGTYGVELSGAGNVLAGSYFSARRVSQ